MVRFTVGVTQDGMKWPFDRVKQWSRRVIGVQRRETRGRTGWNIRRQFRRKEYSGSHVPRPLEAVFSHEDV